MDLNYFKGKKITLLGLGLHGGGIGTAEFIVRNGGRVLVTDLKTREQLKPSLEKLKGLKNVEYVLGTHRPEDFKNTDMVIKNPAVPWDNQYVKLALANKIPVEMDSSLFFKLCANQIIGVTGTKGKTTTATMIFDILRATGKKPVRVGVGQISVLNRLDLLKKESIVIFELSSWRLSALGRNKVSPHIAVIKNILPDHLNYYKSMDEYIRDKKFIFLNQKKNDWLILNYDDEIVREFSKEAISQLILFSALAQKTGPAVYIEDAAIYINNGIDSKKLIALNEIKIRGKHNLQNVMAAIAASYAAGLSAEQIKSALPNLKGLAHRLEFLRELRGVKFYNDTSATIPDAVVSALNSFSQPVILIAGGMDKKLNFEKLATEIVTKAKELILLKGSATDKIIEQIKKIPEAAEKFKTAPIFDSMNEAVNTAFQKSQKDDVVLFSPGAASFNLFNNEFDRGNKFIEAVKKLK